jgi:hypothetical protein
MAETIFGSTITLSIGRVWNPVDVNKRSGK